MRHLSTQINNIIIINLVQTAVLKYSIYCLPVYNKTMKLRNSTKFSIAHETQYLRCGCYGCYNTKLRSGLLNNFTKKYCRIPLSNRVQMDQDRRIYRTQQENFKKKLCKYGKSRFLIARLHFLMMLLWGQLHKVKS